MMEVEYDPSFAVVGSSSDLNTILGLPPVSDAVAEQLIQEQGKITFEDIICIYYIWFNVS